MMFFGRKSFLQGGVYHFALLIITLSSFNWGFKTLTDIDIAGRILTGVTIPPVLTAISLCVSAIIVLWNNWID